MTRQRDVTIRMYRQGLGDCFLLTFPRSRGAPFHMLIDCGALNSKHYGQERMVKVVEDIQRTTNGKLNVLAVSHEHWDHISGFLQAEKIFRKGFEVDEVWTAWTEDTSRPEINALKKRFKRKKKAVALAMQRIRQDTQNARLRAYRSAIEDLFGFFGGLGAAGESTTERAWKIALSLGRNVHLDPLAAPIEVAELPGVRFYCLGPPADPEFVKRRVSIKETYDSSSRTLTLADAFLAALDEGEEPEQADLAKPFDALYAISPQEARFGGNSWMALPHRYTSDESHPNYWRTIDDEWLASAGSLALHLDSYTNNTCLAMAIELEPGGRVLLFPGDAQVGNWLSWEKLSWTIPDSSVAGGERVVTSADLLKRTVFYKVGHHGSHNATLREKGLEKMTSAHLVAMIPVHRKTADDQKWEFPFGKLWTRLKEKTGGRVLLADSTSAEEIAEELKRLSEPEQRAFLDAVAYRKLCVEYVLRSRAKEH